MLDTLGVKVKPEEWRPAFSLALWSVFITGLQGQRQWELTQPWETHERQHLLEPAPAPAPAPCPGPLSS